MSVSKNHRRGGDRHRPSLPTGVRIIQSDPKSGEHTIMGVLVDVSDGGIGVATFAPLRPRSVVRIDADLRRSDLSLHLQGRARVVHSTRQPDGRYRVGLQFVEVAYAHAAA